MHFPSPPKSVQVPLQYHQKQALGMGLCRRQCCCSLWLSIVLQSCGSAYVNLLVTLQA